MLQKKKKMADVTNKFNSIREKLKNRNLLKTVALGSALLASSGLSGQNKPMQDSDSQNTVKEQTSRQEKDGKLFSVFKETYDYAAGDSLVQAEGLVFKEGFSISAAVLLDNDLLVVNGYDEQADCSKVAIYDKDTTGKYRDVSDKYIEPGFSYMAVDGKLVGRTESDFLYDHTLVFHKDKSISRFSSDLIPEDAIVTPECFIASKNVALLSEKEVHKLDKQNAEKYQLFPDLVQETMIFPDGTKQNLPPAVMSSRINKDGSLTTYPVSKKEAFDFCLNGMFKDGYKDVAKNENDANYNEYCKFVAAQHYRNAFFHSKIGTTAENDAQKLYLQDKLSYVDIDNVYNIDNFKAFAKAHEKIIRPSKTLVLTPEHFKDAQR